MSAPELLAKLRAAGVGPMDDEELDMAAGWALVWVGSGASSTCEGRAVAAALEARAKLDAVREWAERISVQDDNLLTFEARTVQATRRGTGLEALHILDREPEP